MNEGGGAAGGSSSSSGAGASATKPQQPQQPATTTASDGRTAQPALHLSSDEVNYLIYRYMQESGFVHSSFTFVYESMLGRSNMRISERSIPPGALVSFLQKGLQYVGIEETLQREQRQRGNTANSNKKNKAGGNTSSNNGGKASLVTALSSSLPDAVNLSLLSPTTINAMTRENPPLHLNVPPATAAAAVRARLEAEAQIEAARKKTAIMEAEERAIAEAQWNGKSSAKLTGPQSIPPQAGVTVSNPLTVANSARASMDMDVHAQTAQIATANAMNELHHHQQQQQQHHQHQQQQHQQQQQQQQQHLLPQNNVIPQHHQPQQQSQSQQQRKSALNAAGAAARLAQAAQAQAAHTAQIQQHFHMQIQQEQEKLHLQKLRQEANAAAQAQARGHNPMETMSQVAALASVAEQMGNNMNNNNNNNNSNSNNNNNNNNNSNAGTTMNNGSISSNSNSNKRPSSAKKGPKNKGKSAKQQKTTHSQQQQQPPQASTQGESALNPSAPPLTGPQNSGIASLGEAASRLAAEGVSTDNGAVAKHQLKFQHHDQEYQERSHPVVFNGIPKMSGGGGEENDHHPDHRHLLHRIPHHPETAANLLSRMQQMSEQMPGVSARELNSRQAAATVQELISMNGNRIQGDVQGEIQNYKGASEQPQSQQPNLQQSAPLPPDPISALSSPILQAPLSGTAQQQQVSALSSPSLASPILQVQRGIPEGEAQQQQVAVAATSQVAPKEAAKALDAQIDKEDEATNAKPSEVLELKNHQSEVFMCAWNSVYTDMIATGSGDASARIWKMEGPKAADGLGVVNLLPHGTSPRDRKNKDVTTLEWSSDGKLLATGSYDGVARVWSLSGDLVHTLRGHKGPIFSLKWNKKGNYLLSGSYDKTTIVWDVSVSTGYIRQQFEDHQAPALDVDWKDDNTFASCSTDKTVHICRVGSDRPLKTYTGHTDEVNAVKWDPSGRLLASCSDDCTAKVWDVNSDRTDPMYDFKSHQQEIYTVKWAPTGPGSRNPEKKPLLATASFDGSVRLWNVQDGTCIQVFSRHRDSVYSVAFSPSGNFLASGSLAGQLYIWNVMEGRHIKSFKGKGDIFEVAWNKEETRVAACFSSNVVCILDFP